MQRVLLVIVNLFFLISIVYADNGDGNKIFNYKDINTALIVDQEIYKDKDIIVRDIEYQTSYKEKAIAFLVEPLNSGKYPVILYNHWLGNLWLGDKNSSRTEFLEEAKKMARAGYVSLLLNSAWRDSVAFPWTGHSAKTDIDVTVKTVIEARNGLDILLSQPKADPGKVFYVGHDFGAMTGYILAGVEPRIRKYVLLAGSPRYSSWLLIGSSLNQKQKEQYKVEMDAMEPYRYLQQAVAEKILFQFGNADEWVSKDMAEEVYRITSCSKEIKFYNAAHSMNGEIIERDRIEWINANIKTLK